MYDAAIRGALMRLTGLPLPFAAFGSSAFRAMATGVHRSCRCWVCLSRRHDLLAAEAPCTRKPVVNEPSKQHSFMQGAASICNNLQLAISKL